MTKWTKGIREAVFLCLAIPMLTFSAIPWKTYPGSSPRAPRMLPSGSQGGKRGLGPVNFLRCPVASDKMTAMARVRSAGPKRQRRALPAFLVGCHRSGTTLARFLLDSHPRITCPPESKFIGGLEAFLDYPQATSGLLSMGLDVDDIYGLLRQVVEAVFSAYARRQGKSRWVDKTPNYYRLLPFLDRIFAGQVLYIFMVRHPLDCIQSLDEFVNVSPGMKPDPEFARIIQRYGRGRYAWAEYWKEVNDQILVFAGSCPDRAHFVSYEDLAREPESTLRSMLSFLGESLNPQLIRTALRQKHAAGYEDYKIRQKKKVDTASVGRWRRWPPGEIDALWRLVAPTAARLGYQAPTPPSS